MPAGVLPLQPYSHVVYFVNFLFAGLPGQGGHPSGCDSKQSSLQSVEQSDARDCKADSCCHVCTAHEMNHIRDA